MITYLENECTAEKRLKMPEQEFTTLFVCNKKDGHAGNHKAVRKIGYARKGITFHIDCKIEWSDK